MRTGGGKQRRLDTLGRWTLPLRRLPLGARRPRLGASAVPRRAHPRRGFLDVERDLSSPPGAARPASAAGGGRLRRAAGRAGIGPGVFVVAYGTLGGAERLWWLLRHFGHDDCGVIDLDAWRGPLTAGEETAEPATFESRERAGDTIGLDELRRAASELVVVDAQARAPLARRAEPDRPGPRPHPRRAQRAVERARARAAAGRARRLLRLGRHRLRHAPPPAPRRPRGRLYPGSWSEWEQRDELPRERG